MMGVCSEKRFGSKEPFGFGGLVCRWWFEKGGGSCRFPCVAGRVGAKFVPIVAIAANKVGYFAESLIRHDVLEGHGAGMGGDSGGGSV